MDKGMQDFFARILRAENMPGRNDGKYGKKQTKFR